MEDYLLDANDDLQIDGDFVVGESTLQHQSLLIRGRKGDLRQFAKTNVGIDDYLLDDNFGDVYQECQRQFKGDGMVIRKLQVYQDGQVKADAYYPV
jgi:hypothetical protein